MLQSGEEKKKIAAGDLNSDAVNFWLSMELASCSTPVHVITLRFDFVDCYNFVVKNGWDTTPVRGVKGQPELLYKWVPQSWGPGIHLLLDGGFQCEHMLKLAAGFCIKAL